ncbi:hypothetical protein DFH07DRAFT_1065663 [Mycena maculata]|uniref:BTB domain-containing protein n=1 Tax=Mycena maculata TaxID=230809 RepID=A0AAD7HZF5_9AGAR|nr:hypothetical protein DFH07DRAFT_1065663 [Mycena maculata]
MDQQETRVEDLWFSNDTLVIRAEKKLFRVSKSLLAARSSVFRDMAAFPQPSGDTELIDGSPVVSLHDSAADVEVLLRAIFDSSYFMPPPERVRLDVTLGILRLSHKYDIEYLYRRALSHLSLDYCFTSAEQYRARPTSGHVLFDSDDRILAHLPLIEAATEVGALWLLPIAYYYTSVTGRDALRDTIPLPASENTVQKCITAFADLILGNTSVSRFLSMSSTAECENEGVCNKFRLNLLSVVFFQMQVTLHPLDNTWDEQAWRIMGEKMCSPCLNASRANHTAALETFWDRLPSIYGLPPWTELETMRSAAMGEST